MHDQNLAAASVARMLDPRWYAKRTRLEDFHVLQRELTTMVRSLRGHYKTAGDAMAANLNPRIRGERLKLYLNLDDLAVHMEHHRNRARIQAELRVYVPLLQRVNVALEQWEGAGTSNPSKRWSRLEPLRFLLRFTEPAHSSIFVEYSIKNLADANEHERKTARGVFEEYPFLLPEPDIAPELEPVRPAADAVAGRALPAASARLYARITSALSLTAGEAKLLTRGLRAAVSSRMSAPGQ
jgi:hypothetical protein